MKAVRRVRRFALQAIALLILLFLLFLLWARRPAIDPIAPPPPSAFAPAEIARGAALAKLGGCESCHTVSNLAAFAGGVAIATPFGTIHGANITPDAETGIGRWSQGAFDRAMHEGVSRDGHHLYPAFPYDHFTRIADSDLRALYAFLMTRPPVHATPPPNSLIPPLGFRPFIAGWKLLYFRPGRFAPDPAHDAIWNRGRYLAESLGHCGACHTPHGGLGAEKSGRPFAGGWAEGWYAPPLGRSAPAVRAWSADRLFEYLRTGLSPSHAAAAGPMGSVVQNLAAAPPEDVRAIAVYFAGLTGARRDLPLADRAAQAARAFPLGAALFARACAACHEPGGGSMAQGQPALSLGTALHEDNPRDTVQVILQGIDPPAGAPGPAMPGFADALSDAQVTRIATYSARTLRTRRALARARESGGAGAKAGPALNPPGAQGHAARLAAPVPRSKRSR
jgi:mono/diheme cytochrome c family protein